jgi:hypothetical protein
MAHLDQPHFLHSAKNVIFYALATIPAGLILYTLFMILKGIVTGSFTF